MTSEIESDYFELEEKYTRAKELVRFAKGKVEMFKGQSKYYVVFGTQEEQQKDIDFAEKVLERCQGILSTIRDAYVDAETKFHEQ